MKTTAFALRAGILVLSAGILVPVAWTRVSAREAPPTAVQAYTVKDVPKERVYIKCTGATEAQVLAFRRRLRDEGAEKINLFLPSLIVCDVPVRSDIHTTINESGYRVTFDAELGPGRTSTATNEIQNVRDCYAIAHGLASVDAPIPGPGDFDDRVLEVPPDIVEMSKSIPRLGQTAGAEPRSINQNSEFLIGDVLINLVYPESQGGSDPNTEDWTDQELRDANAGAVSAALAFQERFAYLPMDFVFKVFERVTTGYEPIKHNMNDDGTTWITDALASLGYVVTGHDALLAAHQFNEAGRMRYGTDWAYTCFIVDSRNEPGNIFQGGSGGAGYTAYANLGGPYLVIPFPAGSNDPNDLGEVLLFSQIFQHESVHIFWGLDEYVAQTNLSSCSSRSGYLNYVHGNKVSLGPNGERFGCPNILPCIMDNARVAGRAICRFTVGQIGTADDNDNFIPDVFDVAPTVEFEGALIDTIEESSIVVRMKAKSIAVPNMNPLMIGNATDYAAPLKDATLNVNGSGNVKLVPLDGKWGGTEEDLSFTLTSLSAGRTRVQIVVRNTFGATSPSLEKEIYYVGLKYALFSLDVHSEGIRVAFKTVGATFGAKLELHRIDTVTGDTLLVANHADLHPGVRVGSFTDYWYLDPAEGLVPSREYRYYVVGRFNFRGKLYNPKSDAFTVRAAIPIESGKRFSSAAPNPFNQWTAISIDVPPSYKAANGDVPGTPSGIREEVATAVSVTVFDVLGRRVKDVYIGKMFGQIETFRWDGTNENDQPVPSGIYFVRAQAGGLQEVRKVVVIR